MIRFAMIRVVSGFMNVPIATSSGAVHFNQSIAYRLSAMRTGALWGFSVSRKSMHGCFPNAIGA
jgi:hypothetical protein